MTKCKYLYDQDVACWHGINYDDALKLKNIHAKHVIDKEQCKHKAYRDYTRIKDCKDARRHNRGLLNE